MKNLFHFPDLGLIMPCLFIAGFGLLLEQKFGFFFSALAGSGMMFLGLIDLAYDIQNDIFKKREFGMYMGTLIILIMLIFGPICIIFAWYNF